MLISRRRIIRNFIIPATLFGFVIIFLGCGNWAGGNISQSPNAPSSPVNVTATPGNGAVTITWDASPGATSYNVYYSTQSGVSTTSGSQITGATSPFVISNLSNETTYYFVVTAVSSGGESFESAQVSAMPSALIQAPATPVNVTATPANGAVSISWTLSAGATSYNIYYGTTSGNVRATGLRIVATTSPWTINGLTNSLVYYFVVTAVNSNLESVESSQVSATPALGL